MEPGPPPHLGDKSAAPAFTHKIHFYSQTPALSSVGEGWGQGRGLTEYGPVFSVSMQSGRNVVSNP